MRVSENNCYILELISLENNKDVGIDEYEESIMRSIDAEETYTIRCVVCAPLRIDSVRK